jgi:anti-sigma factor RsiW
MMPMPIDDDALNAFVDGQLPSARAAEVEAAIARDPELAARAAAYRAQNAHLREAFDEWLHEPVPAALIAATARPARASRWLPWAASVAMAMLGIVVGWSGRDVMLAREGIPTNFAREAAFAHAIYSADSRRPVEVAASDAQSLVTWLTRRTGQTALAPDLTSVGFELVGGRLVAGNEKPTALLMYENAAQQRLTLQWRKQSPGTEETQFRYAVENGVGVFYWIDDACAYALSGTLDRRQLLAVARVAYGQIASAAQSLPPR